jgi:predicted dehydrogenase
MLILVVGTGSIGRRHIKNLMHLVEDPSFIFTRSNSREDDYSRKIGANVVSSIKEAVVLKPDLAVIATPSAMHIEALNEILPLSIPCYIEKPVITTMEHCEQLKNILKEVNPVPVTLTGCNLRYLPSLIKLRQSIKDKIIGKIVRVNMQVGQWLPDWRPGQDYRRSYSAKAEQGGGVVLDLIHEIDMARWLFGEFTQIYSIGGQYSQLDINTEDSAVIILGRKNGPAVSIGMDYISRQRIRRYEIVGEKGTLVWDLGSQTLRKISSIDNEVIDDDPRNFDLNDTYLAAMLNFVNAVSNHAYTEQDLLEGLHSVSLALKIKRQLINENNS